MIPITKPVLGKEEVEAVTKVIRSGFIAKGSVTEKLEQALSKKFDRKYCLYLTSGTSALNTTMAILKFKKSDEIITTPFTFIATANAVNYAGARIVFSDIESDSFNIEPKKVAERITKNTKAIIAVDLFGNPIKYKELSKIAKKNNLFMIEDAAQAHGALYKDKPTGSLGHISILSFYASKIITSGEGGALLTDNKKLYKQALSYRSHGIDLSRPHQYNSVGYNFLPTDIQAAILLEQLKKLNNFISLRNKASKFYTNKLKDIVGITPPSVDAGNKHAYSLYTIKVQGDFGDRNKLNEHLNKSGIGSRIYYPTPLHLQPLWKKLGYSFKKGDFPNAENAAKEVLSLPLFPGITTKQQESVIEEIINFKNQN